MPHFYFYSVERFLFDLFLVLSFSMTLLRMLAYEWKTLRRMFSYRRRSR